MKKFWFFLILFKMFLLVLLTSCQSTVPFISTKRSTIYTQLTPEMLEVLVHGSI